MFKPFLLCPNYVFDFNGKCKIDGEELSDGLDDLTLEIKGKNYTFDRKWLGLLAHYEVNLPLKDLVKIDFVVCKSKVLRLRCGHLMR